MAVTFDLRGTADVKAMLDRFSGQQLANRMRRAVRAGGNEFKEGVASEARSEPTGNLPDSFQKVGVKVSSSMRRGGVPTAVVRPKSPLFNIFEPGAGAHEISPAAGGAIGGPAGQRFRSRSFVARRTVRHPGFAARPILHSAFQSREQEARDAVAHVLFDPNR